MKAIWFGREKGESPKKLENIWFYQLNLNTENKSEELGERIIVPYDLSKNETNYNVSRLNDAF